jgi:hypothetical protein
MDNAKRFREFAAECRRLAEKAAAKDRIALLEIAEAWMACAEEAERKAASGQTSNGRSTSA